MSPKPGFLVGVVAGGGLLVQAVDLQQRGVVGTLGQLLGIGDGGFEVGVEVGHGCSCGSWGSAILNSPARPE
jgi:hypothetical protein